MKTVIIPKKEIKLIVRESVREAIEQEFFKLRTLLLPFVSSKEQKDIEKHYNKPSRDVAKTLEIEV